jgi:hypothetical protein
MRAAPGWRVLVSVPPSTVEIEPMPLPRPAPRATLASLLALAAIQAAPAHATTGVYDRYFVTGSATAGAPGDGRAGQYLCNADQFDGGIANLMGCGINTQPGFARTAAATVYDGTVDATGRSTAFLADTTAHGFHVEYGAQNQPITVLEPAFSRGRSAANLADGTVHARVDNNANLGFVAGSARAMWHDIVTLQVADAQPSSITRVQFRVSIDGSLFNDGQTTVYGEQGSGNLRARFSLDDQSSGNTNSPLSINAVAGWEVYRGALTANTPVVENRGGDTVGGSWTTYATSLMVFDGFFDITGAQAVINPSLSLSLDCSIGLQCDYGNTARFAFVGLPSTVTLRSDSGVFLSAVPEPATWALWPAGVLLLTLLGRRRSR